MVMKKAGNVSTDFDFDDGLDDFDFSFGEMDTKDDRKPITKVLLAAKSGVVDTVRSSSFIKKALKDAFPRSMGEAMDLGDEVAESLKSLYDESVKGIKPTIKQAKQAAVKLIPGDSKYLPGALKKLLDDWKQEGNESGDVRREEGREASMSSTLQDIFKAQTLNDHQKDILAEGKENLQEGLTNIRWKTSLVAQNTAAVALQRLDNYQNNITLNYQKKSLELGYRQLFSTQDIGQYLKEDGSRRDTLLSTIAKNSGLPDFVKLTDPEIRSQLAKNKEFTTDKGGIFGNRTKYIKDIQKSVTDKIKTGVMDSNNAASMMIAGLMMGENTDWKTEGAAGLASFGTDLLGSHLAKKGGNKLLDSKFSEKYDLKGKFSKLEGLMDSLPNKLNEFSKSTKYAFDDSIKGKFMSFVQGLIPSMSKIGTVTKVGLKDLNGPASFTKRTERSINDIIPGYLARIFRELQITRTGNKNIKLALYDHDRGIFTSPEAIQKNIIRTVAPARNVEATNTKLDAIVETIDPEKKLSKEQTDLLRKELLSNSADRNVGNAENLANADKYKTGTVADRAVVAAHVKEHLGKHTAETGATFSKQYNHLADELSEIGEAVQTLIDAGHSEALKKTGVLNKSGDKINSAGLLKHYTDESRRAEAKKELAGVDHTGRIGSGPMDVFVEGETTARLTADKMAVGIYINADKKTVITGPDKIANNDITDSANGKVVLKKELLRTCYVMIKDRKVMLSKVAPGVSSGWFKNKEQPANTKEAAQEVKNASTAERGMPAMGSESVATEVEEPTPKKSRTTASAAAAIVKRQARIWKQPITKLVKKLEAAMAPEVGAGEEPVAEGTTAPIAKESQKLVKPKILSVGNALKEAANKTTAGITEASSNLANSVRIAAAPLIAGIIPTVAKVGAYSKAAVVPTLKTIANTISAPVSVGAPISTLPSVADASKAIVEKPVTVSSIKQATNVLSGIATVVNDKVASGIDAAGRIVKDIHVGKENTPRLTAAKIAAKEYFDKATKKVIEKYSDIKGAILDRKGNTVLDDEDSKRLTTFNPEKKTFEAVPVVNSGGKFNSGYSSITTSMPKNLNELKSITKAGLTSAVTNLNSAMDEVDVYVEGEEVPRLTAIKIKAGAYVDKATEKVISKVDDITGEVVDATGKIVLALEDIPKLKYFNVRIAKWSPLWIIGKITKGLWHYQTKIAPKITAWNLRQLWKATKFVGRLAGRALGMAGLEKFKLQKDVYVKGDSEPRLIGRKLSNGEYYDSFTKKQLWRFEDITGPVIDSEGVIVIAEDELPKVFVYDNVIKYLNPFRLVKYLAKKAVKITAWGARKAWTNLKALGSAAAKVGGSVLKGGLRVLGLRMGPQDVHVSGEEDAALTGKRMKAGEYRSKTTGAVITSPNDIDGPVIDSAGQTIIDEKDIAVGLTTVDGKAIKIKTGMLSKAWAGAKVIGSLLYRGTSLKRGLAGLKDRKPVEDKIPGINKPSEEVKPTEVNSATQASPASIANTIKPVTMAEQAQVKATDLLQQMLDHFKGKDTPKMGSYAEEVQEEKDAATKKESSKLNIPLIGGNAKTEADTLKVATKTEGVAEDSLDTLKSIKTLLEVQAGEGALGALPGSGGGAGKGPASGGKWAKAKSALKFGGKALGAAGAAYGAYSAYENVKQGNYGTAALDAAGGALGLAGTGLLSGVSMGGIATAGAAALGTAATVGSGLLAFVSSPVVLGAGALALAGYGAYKGYKYLKTKSLDNFTKLRYTQYGIDTGNSDAVNKIFALEEYLADKLSVDGKNVLIDSKKIDSKKFYSTFDIDPNNSAQTNRFNGWFQNRFKVVYLTHATAINGLTGKTDFSGISELKKEDSQKFLDAVKFMDGPYSYNDVPIEGVKATNSSDVQAAILLCQEDIGKAEKKKDSAMSRALTVIGIKDAGAAEAADLAKKNLAAPTLTAEQSKQSPTIAATPANNLPATGAGRGNAPWVGPDGATAGNASPDQSVANLRSQAGSFSSGAGLNNSPADPSAKVPEPNGAGIAGYRETITGAAKMVGVDPNHLLATAAVESDFKNNAVPGTSSAQGLFQFVRGTWKDMVDKYGRKYGIDANTPPTDPKAASIMGAQFLKDNLNSLAGSTKRAIGVTEGYLAHFLGAGGASSFLKGMETNPNDIAASHADMAKPARDNPDIFRDKASGQLRSYSEIYTLLSNRLKSKAKTYGIELGEMPTAVAGAANAATNTSAGSAAASGSADAKATVPVGSSKRNTGAAPAVAMASGAGSTDVVAPGPNKRVKTVPTVVASSDGLMGPPVSAAGSTATTYAGTDSTYSPTAAPAGSTDSASAVTPGPNRRKTGAAPGSTDLAMGPPAPIPGVTDGAMGPPAPAAGPTDTAPSSPRLNGRLRGNAYGGAYSAMQPPAGMPVVTGNYPAPSKPYIAPIATGPQPELASAYGMTVPAMPTIAMPRATGGFDKTLLVNTETILTQQLDVQKQILAVLSKVGLAGGTVSGTSATSVAPGATPEPTAPTPSSLAYTVPPVPVSMRRVTSYR